MRSAGIEPYADIDLQPGQLLRFRVKGDKAGSRNGWAIFHAGAVSAGAFGSWRTGDAHTWRTAAQPNESPADRTARRRLLADMQQQRQADQLQVQASARVRAQRLWQTARPATDAHPYLQAKRVPAYGIRRLRQMLVIPVRDVHGVLQSLQFIGPDGTKRFLSGGQVRGCYFAIGKPERELLLGEGLATCSTLRQATGSAVAVCFNCANLEPVALALRAKFPRLRLVVCADNDAATPGNPGLTHARAAAKAVGGFLAVPKAIGVRA
jgi:putative DNA primase/helicase